MKRRLVAFFVFLFMAGSLSAKAHAASDPVTHTVVRGDTLWKIAVKYQAGVSEIITANPQISDPNLIYPGQKVRCV